MSTYHRPVPPVGAVSTRMLADLTGMSTDFFILEIKHGELQAFRLGREFRIAYNEAARYLTEKGFPVPDDWTGR